MPQILRKRVQSLSELASRKSLAIQAGRASCRIGLSQSFSRCELDRSYLWHPKFTAQLRSRYHNDRKQSRATQPEQHQS